MSRTVQQLLSDAKTLSNKLKAADARAAGLVGAAQEVFDEIEAMKRFQDDVASLNAAAHNRPRTQLVQGIERENRDLRALQHENADLRCALDEHQRAVEMIMSKYREHVSELARRDAAHADARRRRGACDAVGQRNEQLLRQRQDKIAEMAAVMSESVRVDDASAARDRRLTARLAAENSGLRRMLEIAAVACAGAPPTTTKTAADKDSQT